MASVGVVGRSLASSVLIAILFGVSPAVADDAIPEEAKLYFKNGVELIQGQPPNYQDAYYQFKLAWEKSKSWKVLSNWGLCALKLERDGEAIWAYTEYLRQKDIDPDERKDLERDLLLLNGNAASVTVTSDIADLEIVDARAGSSVPPQTYRLDGGSLTLRLRAGSHALTATSQGRSLRWEVTLSPGRTEEHRFEFAAAPAPAPAAAAPPAAAPATAVPVVATSSQPRDTAPRQSGGTVRTLGYLVAGAGVITLGAGAFMGISAKSMEKDARNDCKTLPVLGFSCAESSRDDFEKAQQKARTANVLYVVGGVAAAGGLAMIIFGGPKRAQGQGLWLAPAVGRTEAGLIGRGAF